MVTKEQLRIVIPRAPEDYVDALLSVPQNWGIDTPEELATFVAELAHESSQFTQLVENLNYTSDRLTAVWPKRFAVDPKAKVKVPNDLAKKYARNPQALANYVYGNRGGNGDEASGDGWKYRGRGPIMITFLNNYVAIDKQLKRGIVANPDLILQSAVVGIESACVFWKMNNLDKYDDNDSAADDGKIINGGTVGLEDRQHYLDTARRAFGL